MSLVPLRTLTYPDPKNRKRDSPKLGLRCIVIAYPNLPGVAPKVWVQLDVFWNLLAEIDFLGWIEQQQQQASKQQAAAIDGFCPIL